MNRALQHATSRDDYETPRALGYGFPRDYVTRWNWRETPFHTVRL